MTLTGEGSAYPPPMRTARTGLPFASALGPLPIEASQCGPGRCRGGLVSLGSGRPCHAPGGDRPGPRRAGTLGLSVLSATASRASIDPCIHATVLAVACVMAGVPVSGVVRGELGELWSARGFVCHASRGSGSGDFETLGILRKLWKREV